MNRLLATTARQRDMLKPVLAPDRAVAITKQRMESGEHVGIMFGRERWGLNNEEVSLADEIVTFPVNPAFASLNIAQAVLLMSYEWMRSSIELGETNFQTPDALPAKTRIVGWLSRPSRTGVGRRTLFLSTSKT